MKGVERGGRLDRSIVKRGAGQGARGRGREGGMGWRQILGGVEVRVEV